MKTTADWFFTVLLIGGLVGQFLGVPEIVCAIFGVPAVLFFGWRAGRE